MRSVVVTLAFLVGWLAYPAALFTSDDDQPVAKSRSNTSVFMASAHAHDLNDDDDALVTVW